MIPKECKRLAEVDFPIAIVSRHAVAEKEARCGHVPKIHIWPAARPTAACRAILLGLLLPDPCDRHCPEGFKNKSRNILSRIQGSIGKKDIDLREALLKFLGHLSNWDNSSNPIYIEAGQQLIKAAHGDEAPLVVDPFAGGGAIPLEALRFGCDAVSSDLNPVACLIQKVVLEDIPRHGEGLAADLLRIGSEIEKCAREELGKFYPDDPDGAKPIAYLWARTVQCESPDCGAEIPLVRSFWVAKKKGRKRALSPRIVRSQRGVPQVEFKIFEPKSNDEVRKGSVSRARATCFCNKNHVLSPERVRAQLQKQNGGADVIFDKSGKRIGGAKLLAVATIKTGTRGRGYREPTDRDYQTIWAAEKALGKITAKKPTGKSCPVPNEPLPLMSGTFNAPLYGMEHWGDLFTARQKLALLTFVELTHKIPDNSPARDLWALCLSKMVDMNNDLSTWQPHAEIPAHMMTRFAIPMKWDFSEAVPISDSSGSVESSTKRACEALGPLMVIKRVGQVEIGDATVGCLPDSSAAVWFTDPPYYFAVPYSDLSDFFFIWLKRALPEHKLLRDPFDSKNPLTPKDRELCEMAHWDSKRYAHKDQEFFEDGMRRAFVAGRRMLVEDGLGCVVFAHKTTEGWEALLSGMIRGGWTITASWPIATEMASRLRARESAALATSVHLVCRPRATDASVGDWTDVLRELPGRVKDWMKRLQSEGVHGADLVFACIGPALEIFSRYSKVETAEGKEVPLAQYLEKVWEVVGRAALEQVLGVADDKVNDDSAGAVEEDARLTALFLWTLQTTAGEVSGDNGKKESVAAEDEDDEDDDDSGGKKGKKGGLTLIHDVVRRFSQPLGIHLPDWDGRIIETKKGVVRLLPIEERAHQIFGRGGASAVSESVISKAAASNQLVLFHDEVLPEPKGRKGRGQVALADEPKMRHGMTTLDKVHAAMLLQASGKANALRTIIKVEQERGPEFLRLANALAALYPKGSEEKRLLEAMLLAVPR